MIHPSVYKAIPSWLVGTAISTPVIAVLQGAILLYDYRVNHGHAPFPNSPSRGVIVAKRVNQNQPPLRLLVIGDSLAAGVGMSESSVPKLPVAIATQLSLASGRPVHWTCIGTPGTSASRIVKDIQGLEEDHSPLLTRFAEWQREQTEKTKQKLEETKEKVQEWWNIDRKKIERAVEREKKEQWPKWRRWIAAQNQGIKRGIKDIRDILLEKEEQEETVSPEVQLQRRKTAVRQIRKYPTLNPSIVGKYDVAIVLTGLNDLKEVFLPFMYSKEHAARVAADKQDAGGEGIMGELLKVVDELRGKMKDILPVRRKTKESSSSSRVTERDEMLKTIQSNSPEPASEEGSNGPLVVFPAIPISAIFLSHLAPLGWFLVPAFHSIDRKKERIAKSYPGLVLFVKPPSPEQFVEVERRGPLWQELGRDDVALSFHDISLKAKDRIEDLMKQHYREWVKDAEENNENLYVVEADSVSSQTYRGEHLHPGATLISADGIHPNDEGYHVWGRMIGKAIASEWRRRNEPIGKI